MQVNIFIRLLIYCLSVLLHMLIAVLVLSKGWVWQIKKIN